MVVAPMFVVLILTRACGGQRGCTNSAWTGSLFFSMSYCVRPVVRTSPGDWASIHTVVTSIAAPYPSA